MNQLIQIEKDRSMLINMKLQQKKQAALQMSQQVQEKDQKKEKRNVTNLAVRDLG